MCSCLFIIGDVLLFLEQQRKKTKKNCISVFNNLLCKKSAKICGSCLRNCTEHIQAALPKYVSYNFLNMICIFLHTIFLNMYVNKLNKMNLYDLKSLSTVIKEMI